MLGIMETHFEYAIKYFEKYDRKKKPFVRYQEKSTFPESLFSQTNEDGVESLHIKEENALLDYSLFPSKKDFEALTPQIKSNLEKYIAKNNLEKIKKESYIRTFLMIYLGVLKCNIDSLVNKNIVRAIDSNETIDYTINVDALLLDRILRGSYNSIKELAIASRFARDELDYKRNVRVITGREEQVHPILQQKSKISLPLKLFYVQARLYERYIHISLNQVVIEGKIPDTNAKNIVIKSKIVTSLGYLFDSICDNLWVAVDPNEYLQTDANCKKHNEDHNQSQQEGFSTMDELNGFKKKPICVTKKVGFYLKY
jgi:hypothetical protein